ncbi:MAG: nuclear transport factor 2 family protein [Rhizobiaceae bacterium]|nr:nuclear transport factor 2 family protein [Rhizobiaceae bacterium]
MMTQKTLLTTLMLFMALGNFKNALAQNTSEEITTPPQLVERWYGALGGVDRRGFEELIAEDAKIVLKDLGVEQTKSEFIAALDEWEKSTRNANIIFRYELIEDDSASVLVCYRFETNEQLISESFTFSNDQITGSVQEFKSDNCGDM